MLHQIIDSSDTSALITSTDTSTATTIPYVSDSPRSNHTVTCTTTTDTPSSGTCTYLSSSTADTPSSVSSEYLSNSISTADSSSSVSSEYLSNSTDTPSSVSSEYLCNSSTSTADTSCSVSTVSCSSTSSTITSSTVISSSPTISMHRHKRVKLYALSPEKAWDDRGTGHVTCVTMDKLQTTSLLVHSESDGVLLLDSKVQRETVYQRQQDTLIVWSEGDTLDLALSFQERSGCDDVWRKICEVHGCDSSLEVTPEFCDESEDERLDDTFSDHSVHIPPAELSRLPDLLQIVSSCMDHPVRRDRLAFLLEENNYIIKLTRLFRICEDLEDTEALYNLHDIMKNIFYLNKSQLLETMFQDNVLFDVVGCLEYNRHAASPALHRQYLRKLANFKQALPLDNCDLIAKIHQTYRVQYLQDVILPTPSVFEDNMLVSLSNFIYVNKLEILKHIQDDEKFLQDLFACLNDDKLSLRKRRDCVYFLKELCCFSYTLQQQNKEVFFKTLTLLGVLPALELCLSLDEPYEDNISCTSDTDLTSPTAAAVSPLLPVTSHKHSATHQEDESCGSTHSQRPVTATDCDNKTDASLMSEIHCATIDVLSHLVESVPSTVREHVLDHLHQSACYHGNEQATGALCVSEAVDGLAPGVSEEALLVNLLIEQMVCKRDLAVQLCGLLRALIDPENMSTSMNRSEKTEFLTFFYRHCMHNLVAPLLAITSNGKLLHDDLYSTQLMSLILDLISFCCEHHTFHAKNFIITKCLVARVLVLMQSQHKYLSLDALRFIRKLVALKDEYYNRHIIKNNLLKPVVDAFCVNRGRYNLLDSAITELFEFIRIESIRPLIAYVAEQFGSCLVDVSPLSTFSDLCLRYEQQKDKLNSICDTDSDSLLSGKGHHMDELNSPFTSLVSPCVTRFRRDVRDMDSFEERYFSEESEDAEEFGADTHQTVVMSALDDVQIRDSSDFCSVASVSSVTRTAAIFSDILATSAATRDPVATIVDSVTVSPANSHVPTHSPAPAASAALSNGDISTLTTSGACVLSSPVHTTALPPANHLASSIEAANSHHHLTTKVSLVDYEGDSDDEEAMEGAHAESVDRLEAACVHETNGSCDTSHCQVDHAVPSDTAVCDTQHCVSRKRQRTS